MKNNKLIQLQNNLRELGNVTVAYSGGVDSSFLLRVAKDVLGSNVFAVIINSCVMPERELNVARKQLLQTGVKFQIKEIDLLKKDSFINNSFDRCYYCKKHIFDSISKIAYNKGCKYVVEGSNLDDEKDYRPGKRALKELGVLSPLKHAEMTKNDIRRFSKCMQIPSWNKPSFSCLASRIPYGNMITKEKLEIINCAEEYLLELGFEQLRVRYHGDIARIELPKQDFEKMLYKDTSRKVYKYFKGLGFVYTALDIKGYRTGSLNESIHE